jgi:hypothetical protein
VSDERICSDEIVYILSQRVEKVRMELGDERGKMKAGDGGEGCGGQSLLPGSCSLAPSSDLSEQWNEKLVNMWHCHRLEHAHLLAFADVEINHHRKLQPSRLPLEVVKLAGLWLAGGSDPLTSRSLHALHAPRVKLNLEGSPTPTSSPSLILNSIQFKPQPNTQANCLSHSSSVVRPTV